MRLLCWVTVESECPGEGAPIERGKYLHPVESNHFNFYEGCKKETVFNGLLCTSGAQKTHTTHTYIYTHTQHIDVCACVCNYTYTLDVQL